MKPAIYAGHRITRQGLVVRSDSSEIIIPLVEASKLLSAVQRATSESDNRQRHNGLHRRMKLT